MWLYPCILLYRMGIDGLGWAAFDIERKYVLPIYHRCSNVRLYANMV